MNTNGTLKPDLRELRFKAASLGITVEGKDRFELCNDIHRKEQQVETLRRKCAAKGLDTSGDAPELRLRLARHGNTGVNRRDRRLYRIAGIGAFTLGIAALGVSIPHVAAAFREIMQIGLGYSILLAVIVDCGICLLKLIDTLSYKFELPRTVKVTAIVLMAVCLIFSAAFNGSQFLQHAEGVGQQTLAVAAACFLSLFVFCMFLIGSVMCLKCQERKLNGDPARLFKEAAAQFERLAQLAKGF